MSNSENHQGPQGPTGFFEALEMFPEAAGYIATAIIGSN
jgi:hypothetical protein